MVEINGKYNTAKVFTDTADEATKKQIETFCDQEAFSGSKIRIMPDCHAGKGCTIGTTMTIKDKVIPGAVGVDIGCFTGDTEVWCSSGCYLPIKELAEEFSNKSFIVDSFDEDQSGFVVQTATAFKTRENAELVAVTYHNEQHTVTVRCTPDHKFLCCFEPDLSGSNYKSHTLYWKEAKDLKRNDRLVAKDSRVFVDDVTVLDEREDVYCLNVAETHNFTIKFGVVVHNCGMRVVEIEDKKLDLQRLDKCIHRAVPHGYGVNKKLHRWANEL